MVKTLHLFINHIKLTDKLTKSLLETHHAAEFIAIKHCSDPESRSKVKESYNLIYKSFIK